MGMKSRAVPSPHMQMAWLGQSIIEGSDRGYIGIEVRNRHPRTFYTYTSGTWDA
jgi:hypothetical protein